MWCIPTTSPELFPLTQSQRLHPSSSQCLHLTLTVADLGNVVIPMPLLLLEVFANMVERFAALKPLWRCGRGLVFASNFGEISFEIPMSLQRTEGQEHLECSFLQVECPIPSFFMRLATILDRPWKEPRRGPLLHEEASCWRAAKMIVYHSPQLRPILY